MDGFYTGSSEDPRAKRLIEDIKRSIITMSFELNWSYNDYMSMTDEEFFDWLRVYNKIVEEKNKAIEKAKK